MKTPMSHPELIQLIEKTLLKLPKDGTSYNLRDALTDDQWPVVRLYLVEKGLAKIWGGSVVTLTAEGLRIAGEGYNNHLEQLRMAENEPRRFNRLTLLGTVASLLISAAAAYYAHQDSQRSDEDKAQLNAMQRSLKLQQQQILVLTAKVSALSTSAVLTPQKAVPVSDGVFALPQAKHHAPASTPQNNRHLPAKASAGTPNK
jgi:hypothetical protein